ncbi:MAG TPA: hypothetical protein PKE47_16115 [Verrucomicrobiota bacterium]|nr:hypothetical protein [Verrucomicrobiota bacterium]
MNAKLLLKSVVLLLVLLLLVIMGMNNRGTVDFSLPPLFTKLRQPAAIMYFAFFPPGLLTGTLLPAGGGKKGAGAGGSRSSSSK